MPLTFLAHQGPLLPLTRRWPLAIDGVALVIGTMAPDFAYVLDGSRFQVWAHGFPALFLFCIPVTIVVSWLIVRALAPVVPDHLPQLGDFRLREFRGLATHRFVWWTAILSAAIGAVSHVLLDIVTHRWGWPARHWAWYVTPLTARNWFGRDWTPFRVAQYVGHIGGIVLCVWLLWRYGRAGWMSGRAARVPAFVPTALSHLSLWGCTATGLTAAALWTRANPNGFATDVLRLSTGAFVGMLIGALVARHTTRRRTDGPEPVVSERTVP